MTTAFAALLTLSGCFRIDMAVTIHPNDTVDATMIMAVNQSMLSLTGSTVDDLFPDSDFEGATSAPFSDGDLVGKTFTIKNQPLSTFNEGKDDSSGSLTAKHVNGTYVVDGTLDLSSGESDATTLSMIKTGTVKIAFTFPGKVTDANGTIDTKTNTVTWHPSDPTQPLKMHAVAKDSADSGVAPWMLYGGGGLAVVIIAGVVVLLVVRSRRKAEPITPSAVEDALGPQYSGPSVEPAGPVLPEDPTTPGPQQP